MTSESSVIDTPDLSGDLTNLGSVRDQGFGFNLSARTIGSICSLGFRGDNLKLALAATSILIEEKPMTLRGLMYQVVSAGWLPSTDNVHYRRIGRLMSRLREARIVPYSWIVDGVRSTIKPSSWSGIEDFADTVRDAYRKDFWSTLPAYVHIICEKDAVAGTLSPVTSEFDVALSPLRGYSSLSFAHEIGETWNQVDKPIFCYYLGDFDPSGFDLERDIIEKLKDHTRDTHPDWWYADPEDGSSGNVVWERLGVNSADFSEFNLLPLKVKKSDTRSKKFIDQHGTEAAELDAIPSTELRRRVREAIEQHIPTDEWERLQEIEAEEKESFNAVLDQLSRSAKPDLEGRADD